MLSSSDRVTQIDKKIDEDIANTDMSNQLFVRLIAKKKVFTGVDFKYSIFETCYLRQCKFDSCNFTGCRFEGTNFEGSTFLGCTFDYATFERTGIDNEILSSGCPGHENLKMRFARTLRMNYLQLGDAKSVNKAMAIELLATEAHLHKAWKSPESYYRRKYSGSKRFRTFVEWTVFKILEFLWGNGESAWKVLRAIFLAMLTVSIWDAVFYRDAGVLRSYGRALKEALYILMGIMAAPPRYPLPCLTVIVLIKLIVFSVLTAIILKRFDRR